MIVNGYVDMVELTVWSQVSNLLIFIASTSIACGSVCPILWDANSIANPQLQIAGVSHSRLQWLVIATPEIHNNLNKLPFRLLFSYAEMQPFCVRPLFPLGSHVSSYSSTDTAVKSWLPGVVSWLGLALITFLLISTTFKSNPGFSGFEDRSVKVSDLVFSTVKAQRRFLSRMFIKRYHLFLHIHWPLDWTLPLPRQCYITCIEIGAGSEGR